MLYDIIIIGGGIVGLATGLKLKEQKPELKVAILEKESELAKHQTGNNSGVIHSGLYYKPGSLKATNCIAGYHQLIQFCEEENIPFEIGSNSKLGLIFKLISSDTSKVFKCALTLASITLNAQATTMPI